MTVTLGSGEWTFEVEESWAKIPDEVVLGDCAAVGVDSKDNVYAFNRGDIRLRSSTGTATCCAPGARASLRDRIASRTACMSRPTTRSG